MKNITCIEDLRRIAKRKVPRAFFEYADCGSYSEETLRANRADLEKVKLRQRVFVDVDTRKLDTVMVGEPASLPIALAPTGLTGMQHADGEILACQAAHAAGVQFTLSTMSICSIEAVAAANPKPFWFQLYVMRDRGFARSLIQRARDAKCSALMVTADLQIQGQRHRDIKNGLTVPPQIKLANILDIMTKPGWALRVLRGKHKSFGNLEGHIKGMDGIKSLAQWTASQFDPTLCWEDLEWIRKEWGGKIIIKGILDVEDAKVAAKTGAQAIVVSNHGGRQLDGAASSISMLPRVLDAVGSNIEVLFDGGVRSGQDVVRAMALGAKGCLIGRAFLYGLGAGGGDGVREAIEIIRKEMDVTMALTGVTSVDQINRSILVDGGPFAVGAPSPRPIAEPVARVAVA
jgi:L-lactate dehydrogenase (cytochrome)